MSCPSMVGLAPYVVHIARRCELLPGVPKSCPSTVGLTPYVIHSPQSSLSTWSSNVLSEHGCTGEQLADVYVCCSEAGRVRVRSTVDQSDWCARPEKKKNNKKKKKKKTIVIIKIHFEIWQGSHTPQAEHDSHRMESRKNQPTFFKCVIAGSNSSAT